MSSPDDDIRWDKVEEAKKLIEKGELETSEALRITKLRFAADKAYEKDCPKSDETE